MRHRCAMPTGRRPANPRLRGSPGPPARRRRDPAHSRAPCARPPAAAGCARRCSRAAAVAATSAMPAGAPPRIGLVLGGRGGRLAAQHLGADGQHPDRARTCAALGRLRPRATSTYARGRRARQPRRLRRQLGNRSHRAHRGPRWPERGRSQPARLRRLHQGTVRADEQVDVRDAVERARRAEVGRAERRIAADAGPASAASRCGASARTARRCATSIAARRAGRRAGRAAPR